MGRERPVKHPCVKKESKIVSKTDVAPSIGSFISFYWISHYRKRSSNSFFLHSDQGLNQSGDLHLQCPLVPVSPSTIFSSMTSTKINPISRFMRNWNQNCQTFPWISMIWATTILISIRSGLTDMKTRPLVEHCSLKTFNPATKTMNTGREIVLLCLNIVFTAQDFVISNISRPVSIIFKM